MIVHECIKCMNWTRLLSLLMTESNLRYSGRFTCLSFKHSATILPIYSSVQSPIHLELYSSLLYHLCLARPTQGRAITASNTSSQSISGPDSEPGSWDISDSDILRPPLHRLIRRSSTILAGINMVSQFDVSWTLVLNKR